MTVAVDIRSKGYTATGVTDTFPSDFPFFELEVYLDGALVSTSEYTITQATPGGEGSVVFNDNPTGDLVIASATEQEQQVDFISVNAVEPEVVELSLDRLTMMVQDQQRDLDRAIKNPITDLTTPTDWTAYPLAIVSTDEDGKLIPLVPDAPGYVFVDDVTGEVTVVASADAGLAGDMQSTLNLADVVDAATAFDNIKQAATATATGVVELATSAETTTGTDTVRAVTPAGVKAVSDALTTAYEAADTAAIATARGYDRVVKSAYAETASYSSTTAAIPVDDTIPDVAEGTQVLTLAFTPTDAANDLVVDVGGLVLTSTSANAIIAIFDGSTCKQVTTAIPGNGVLGTIGAQVRYAAGTADARNISVRVGIGSGTLYINGDGSSRLYGGATKWQLRVTEIKPEA